MTPHLSLVRCSPVDAVYVFYFLVRADRIVKTAELKILESIPAVRCLVLLLFHSLDVNGPRW